MFLSLLKVVAISIISAVSFNGVADSSVVHTDESAITSKVGRKNASINVVDSTNYLKFSNTDLHDLYSGFVYEGNEYEGWWVGIGYNNLIMYHNSILGRLEFTPSTYKVNTTLNHVVSSIEWADYENYVSLDDNYIPLYRYMRVVFPQSDSDINYGLYMGLIYNDSSHTVLESSLGSFYFLEIPSTSSNAFGGLVNYDRYIYTPMVQRLYEVYTFTISWLNLNSIVFYNTSDYLSELWTNNHYAFSYIHFDTYYKGEHIESYASGTDWYIHSGNVNDISLQLWFHYQDYQPIGDFLRGFWCILDNTGNGAIVYQDFSEDLIISFGNYDTYVGMLNAVQRDINLNPSVNYEGGYSYSFNNNINFNAPFNTSAEMNVVAISSFVEGGATSYIHEIYLPEFVSNGYLFNKIELKYISAYDKYFRLYDAESNTEGIRYFDMYGYGFFYSMSYINTESGLHINVFNRDVSYVGTSDSVVPYYSLTCSWVNSNYRTLSFERELRSYELDRITIFSNSYDTVTSVGSGGSLATAFRLINNTLIGLSGFFGIEILPGITLGVLVLMPFAVSLMLFVIHLFKR